MGGTGDEEEAIHFVGGNVHVYDGDIADCRKHGRRGGRRG